MERRHALLADRCFLIDDWLPGYKDAVGSTMRDERSRGGPQVAVHGTHLFSL